jgi:putative NADH-flavin reductase
MKIAIFGATGPTGQELVKQALERGDTVTALARNEKKLTPHPNLRVVQGDALDPEAVAKAIEGQDVIISSLGGAVGVTGAKHTTVYSQGAKNIVLGMRRHGVKRLIFCTSGGVEDHDPGAAWFYEHVIKPMILQNAYDDMKLAEAVLWGLNDLECIIVRPPRLIDGPKRGNFRVTPRFVPEKGTDLTRADLADFMLAQTSSNDWVGKTPTLAY